MSKVNISVITTVYNGETTIEKTILSILKQTIQDFEYIIVNDGSSDTTADILKKFSQKDNRIKVIESKKIGRSKSLNLAIKESTGNFIANIDADDEAHPKRLEYEYSFLKDNTNIGLVCSDSLIIFDNEMPKWIDYSGQSKERKIGSLLKRSNPISHSSIMINTKIINKSEYYYDEKRTKVVDYELWIRLYVSGYDIVLIEKKLVAKRIHNNQSFENKERKKYLKQIYEVQLNGFKGLLTPVDLVFINMKYVYGLLPQKIRMLKRK